MAVLAVVFAILILPGSTSAQTVDQYWINEDNPSLWLDKTNAEIDADPSLRPLIMRAPVSGFGQLSPLLTAGVAVEVGDDTLEITFEADEPDVFTGSATGTLNGVTITVSPFINALGNWVAGQFRVEVLLDDTAQTGELSAAQFLMFHIWPFFTYVPVTVDFPGSSSGGDPVFPPGGPLFALWIDFPFDPFGEIWISKDVTNLVDLNALDPAGQSPAVFPFTAGPMPLVGFNLQLDPLTSWIPDSTHFEVDATSGPTPSVRTSASCHWDGYSTSSTARRSATPRPSRTRPRPAPRSPSGRWAARSTASSSTPRSPASPSCKRPRTATAPRTGPTVMPWTRPLTPN